MAYNLLIFDLEFTGHHATYIFHLVKYWCSHKLDGKLKIVISPSFKEKYVSDFEQAFPLNQHGVEFIEILAAEVSHINLRKTRLQRLTRALKEWHLLCKYAKDLQADHCLIMYLDTCELPLLLRRKPPCPVSGIYFRPSFHYPSFSTFSSGWKSYLQHLREKAFIRQTIRLGQFKHIFCIDPFVSKIINKAFETTKAVHLADPVEIEKVDGAAAKSMFESLEVQPSRKIFFLFGSLDTRKGVYKFLDALLALPDESCRQICLLMVGTPRTSESKTLERRMAEVVKCKPIQLITRFDYVPEADVPIYFQVSDFVLALYQQHVGMSGILLLAAAANKPVISSDYGLMGELVRQFELGVTVDATSAKAISKVIAQLLLTADTPKHSPEKARNFAEMNSAERFARTLFEYTAPNLSTIAS